MLRMRNITMYVRLYCIHVKKSRVGQRDRPSAGGFSVRLISTKFIEGNSSLVKLPRNSPLHLSPILYPRRLSVLTNRYFYTSQWHRASVLLITRHDINPGKHTVSGLMLEMGQGHEITVRIDSYPFGRPFSRPVTVKSLLGRHLPVVQ